ncbi:MAG TPA: Rpp14/Pop5 family protein [Candidatus Saccharimonadales bacterium]|nr:Rpp14/Pop5 family protein [Candidatus Saccharimonadales bacterium]
MILKRKYRYVLVLASKELDAARETNNISAELMRFMGEVSYSEANPRIVAQYTPKLFVFKVNRGHEGKLILGLSFVKQAGGSKTGLYTVKTSGTIKSLLIYANQIKD